MRRNEFGLCYAVVYVDDNLMIGHEAAINKAFCQIKQEELVIKVGDTLYDYLLCGIVFSGQEKGLVGTTSFDLENR